VDLPPSGRSKRRSWSVHDPALRGEETEQSGHVCGRWTHLAPLCAHRRQPRAVPAPTAGEVKRAAALTKLWASPSGRGWFRTGLDAWGHATRLDSMTVLMFVWHGIPRWSPLDGGGKVASVAQKAHPHRRRFTKPNQTLVRIQALVC